MNKRKKIKLIKKWIFLNRQNIRRLILVKKKIVLKRLYTLLEFHLWIPRLVEICRVIHYNFIYIYKVRNLKNIGLKREQNFICINIVE